jgi:hypothetical protein
MLVSRSDLVREVKLLGPLSRFITSIERRLVIKSNYTNVPEIARRIH